MTPLPAYESYHDPNQDDAGYCATCHPGFTGGRTDTLHAKHTGGEDPVTSNCNLCHTGSGRDNPLMMWSTGDAGNGLGCLGCHGQDYGETIQANYRGFAIVGRHKNSGYGLRRRHARAGVTICATCHTNDLNVAPYPENVFEPGLGFTVHYYSRLDVSLQDQPVRPCSNEDTLNDADAVGLDNDGDGVYDGNDPDCTGAPITLRLMRTGANTLEFTWPATFDGWRLQTIAGLGETNWIVVPVVAQETTNGFWRIVLSPPDPKRFYQLLKGPY